MNSNSRHWQISIATFFVISLLAVSADALDATDYTRMHNLSQKTIQLQRDILSANQGARGNAVDCFEQLYTNLEQVSLRIGFWNRWCPLFLRWSTNPTSKRYLVHSKSKRIVFLNR